MFFFIFIISEYSPSPVLFLLLIFYCTFHQRVRVGEAVCLCCVIWWFYVWTTRQWRRLRLLSVITWSIQARAIIPSNSTVVAIAWEEGVVETVDRKKMDASWDDEVRQDVKWSDVNEWLWLKMLQCRQQQSPRRGNKKEKKKCLKTEVRQAYWSKQPQNLFYKIIKKYLSCTNEEVFHLRHHLLPILMMM